MYNDGVQYTGSYCYSDLGLKHTFNKWQTIKHWQQVHKTRTNVTHRLRRSPSLTDPVPSLPLLATWISHFQHRQLSMVRSTSWLQLDSLKSRKTGCFSALSGILVKIPSQKDTLNMCGMGECWQAFAGNLVQTGRYNQGITVSFLKNSRN